VLFTIAGGGRWRDGATSISCDLSLLTHLVKQVTEAGFHEGPRALVLWFLLYPLHLCVAVTRKTWLDVSEREWGNLLHSHNRDILNATLGPFALKIIIDLTAAEENFFDLTIGNKVSCCLLNYSFESEADRKFFHLRASSTELQELLGDGDNQWLPEISPNLPPKQVEVLSCGRAIAQTEVHVFVDL
jgi:hypothetical protein